MNTEVELDRIDARASGATAIVLVFGLALFTSAALLFWVQPLIAKMLLPLLGGAPSVWNTCMLFFQALLLAGYAYSLMISQRLSLRNQAIVHAVLLLAAALVLPFGISSRLARIVTDAIESDILAADRVVRNCRSAVPAALRHRAVAAAMVLAYEPQISARSVFSLRDQ